MFHMKHFGTIGDSANIHVEGAAREELKVWGWRDPILHVRRVFFRPVCIASSLGFGKRNELCFAGTVAILPLFQSSFACSIRSIRDSFDNASPNDAV
jgi:hypothetical protein